MPLGQFNHCGNHSGDPNLWWIDAYTLAARRPIIAGEEVTNDYAASTGTTDFAMACTCGSSLCRGTVSGQDWQLPELQERYKDHRVPALLNRIRECW